MAVSERELKCYEYICAIKDIEDLQGSGIYRADRIREELHDELCKLFSLDKQATKQFTYNLDKLQMNGTNLYLALLEESRKAK